MAQETPPAPAKLNKLACALLNCISLQLHALFSAAYRTLALRESPEGQQERHLRRNGLMQEAGVPLRHLPSEKEKLSRAAWGPGWIVDSGAPVGLLTLPYCSKRGRLTGSRSWHFQPLPAADSLAQRDTCSLGLHVSMSPFLAFVQEGQSMTQ